MPAWHSIPHHLSLTPVCRCSRHPSAAAAHPRLVRALRLLARTPVLLQRAPLRLKSQPASAAAPRRRVSGCPSLYPNLTSQTATPLRVQSYSPVCRAALLCRLTLTGACKEGTILQLKSTGISCYAVLPKRRCRAVRATSHVCCSQVGWLRADLDASAQAAEPIKDGAASAPEEEEEEAPEEAPPKKRGRKAATSSAPAAKATAVLASSAPAGRTAKVSAGMREPFDDICCSACILSMEGNH